MDNKTQEDQIIVKLTALKQRHGDEAEYVSKAGFPFNVFDDLWTLDGLGDAGTYIDWKWMHEAEYSDEDFILIRTTFAEKAQIQIASGVKLNARNLRLHASAITDVVQIKRDWTTYPDTKRKSITTLLSWMAEKMKIVLWRFIYGQENV